MLSLVFTVRSMIATIVVVVVLLPLIAHHSFDALEPRQQFDEVVFDTPSWRAGSLTITPPTVADVDKEVLFSWLSLLLLKLSFDGDEDALF